MPGGSAWQRPPAWVRIVVHLAGVLVILYEMLSERSPRFPLMVVAVLMMGLIGPDMFDRFLPGGGAGHRDESEP